MAKPNTSVRELNSQLSPEFGMGGELPIWAVTATQNLKWSVGSYDFYN